MIKFDDDDKPLHKKKCLNCGDRQIVLTKIIHTQFMNGNVGTAKTQNRIVVCTNPNCWRYQEVKLGDTWVRDDELITQKTMS